MTIIQAVILGIIQGITEFLPISSSAHLVITPYLLGWNLTEEVIFPFDVLVQIGTLLAVIIYFRKDLWEIVTAVIDGLRSRKPLETPAARLGWLLLLATIPAGILGLLLNDLVESVFKDPPTTAVFLIVTALLLIFAEVVGKRTREIDSVTWKDALWIGFAQALALFPGISRSGSTMTGGMTRNLTRPAAARFSFLMSIPVMLAAGAFSLFDLFEIPNLGSFLPSMAAGFISAAVVGYFSIRWLLAFIGKHPLYIFSLYCVILAAVTLLVAYV